MKKILLLAVLFAFVPLSTNAFGIVKPIVNQPSVIAIPQENDGGTPVVVTTTSSGFSGYQSERSGCEMYWPGTKTLTPCYFETQAVMRMLASLETNL